MKYMIEIHSFKAVSEEKVRNYLNDGREELVIMKIFNKILNARYDQNGNLLPKDKVENLDQIVNRILDKPEFDVTKDLINQVSKNERLIRPLLDIVSENNVPKKEIKVLEINLSNALMAIDVENYLASAAIYPIAVDYVLVNSSIENLSKDFKNKSYKLLEWNLNECNFPKDLQPVDLLVYRDSYNLWHLKLDNYLHEIYGKVRDKGFLLAVFRNKFTPPEILLNQLCEQNSVNDSELSERINNFKIEAQNIGFKVICDKCDSIGLIAILFRKVSLRKDLKPKKQNVIEIVADYEKWFEILKEKFSKFKDNESKDENFWLIANDSSINGIIGLTLCLRQEPGGDRIRCIFDYDKKLKLPINFEEKPFSDIITNDLAINVLRDGKLGTYRHISLTKNDEQSESYDYYLNIGQRGDLSSLQLFDSKNVFPVKIPNDDNSGLVDQIRCNVYCSGLIFRDVMLASGYYIFLI
jgi:fatty acid synthase